LSKDCDSTDILRPSHSFPISKLSLEFPTTAPGKITRAAKYVYACSNSEEDLSAALGQAAKIDIIAKLDVSNLVSQGRRRNTTRKNLSVDSRTCSQILMDNQGIDSDISENPIQLFKFPNGVFGGEPRFVPSAGSQTEDDGHLLFFAFDESQLLSSGEAPKWATSELWILDARGMKDVVARVKLTQRVPYGLHGEWFHEQQIREQKIRNRSSYPVI